MGFGQIETLALARRRLAFERQEGAAPTFVWLGGFKSDMTGTKAQALAEWARDCGQGFVRFDYSGHGQSSGRFEDGAISVWLDDTLAVLDGLTAGPLALVGSSMGGWLAMLAAQARPERVAGLILIAPAADFTQRLMWPSFTPEQQSELLAIGRLSLPSAYAAEPTIISRTLIEDGARNCVLGAPYRFAGPAIVLQGGADPDVPAAHGRAVFDHIQAPDKRFDLIADGDHRLSRPQDIARLLHHADTIAGQLAGALAR